MNKTELHEHVKRVGATIFDQISQNTRMCLAASDFAIATTGEYDWPYLRMRYRVEDGVKSFLSVILDEGADTYIVRTERITRKGVSIQINEVKDVYAEDLDGIVFSLGSSITEGKY